MSATGSLLTILYWAPRALGLLLAAFVGLFALDVFAEGQGWLRTIGALLIHLIPTYLVLAAVWIGWKWEWAGGVVFLGLGLGYVLVSRGRVPVSAHVALAGPAILTGLLFFAHWWASSKASGS